MRTAAVDVDSVYVWGEERGCASHFDRGVDAELENGGWRIGVGCEILEVCELLVCGIFEVEEVSRRAYRFLWRCDSC